MPFTPYHFGPSGFIGLLLRRWLDVPVFVAANILIDVEVLADAAFQPGWPVHQLWHFHTLLIGGLVGALFGLIIYSLKPLRWLCEKSMGLIGLPVKATWLSMILAGLFGVWLHVGIDSVYHYDIQLLWPHPFNVLGQWLSRLTDLNQSQLQPHVLQVCRILYIHLFALCAILLVRRYKSKNSAAKESR